MSHMSGLRSRRKNDTAHTPELLFHEHGSGSKAPGFMSVAPSPELSFSWLRLQLGLLFVFTS